ncbi:hypothetical protein FE391_39735 [Nonomuraea sp. KC401]|uniref:hypothetical protein n=1 Tax=unclassified Nonomuraea TaxID=2593643 RepID=UPI0010FDC14A|nr:MULTISPECIES: hypothetical protein [unclassified Nonomuraea]NBE93311.1 hypothetical protein [Nonomuraea sp. K271]TLF56197.1 hypothetical protein FE391_39735 [Nonomuraea sp. KC401]
MMRRLAAATCVAFGLMTVTAAPAMAAKGRLVLRGAETTSVLTDPGPGCYRSTVPFTTVANDTDTAVTVHSGPGCAGPSLVVPPGRTTAVGERLSVSVPS